ncbi:MAG: hypothetical protein LBF49_00450 [Puniceicoccales bacterium]|jgi:hypothetical protein|nr:hypothetical protein [Puniceicoccales bacterium]
MAIRRNGMGDPDDPMDEGKYQRAMEMYNEYIMNRVEILLEDDNHRNFWE